MKKNSNVIASLLTKQLMEAPDKLESVLGTLPGDVLNTLAASLLKPIDLIAALAASSKGNKGPKVKKKKPVDLSSILDPLNRSNEEDVVENGSGGSSGQTQLEVKLMEYARGKGPIGFSELTIGCGVPKVGATKALSALVDRGVFTKTGVARGTKYELQVVE